MHTSTATDPAGAAPVQSPHRSTMQGLVADLWPRRGPARLLGYTAGMWLVSAVLHSVVFVFDDTAWAGAVSWRKPIVFSLSIGLLLWAFGWILDRLPDRPKLAWGLGAPFALASTAEVALIALQQWRGRPSHFNTFESGNAAVFAAMGMLVVVMSVALVGLFIWSLIERPSNRVERIAIIGGLAMVMPGLGVGQWMITLGDQYVEQFNRVPETVLSGEAGVAKFPHAIAFHGIQVFMVAAALIGRSAVQATTATRAMWVTVSAYLGVLIFSAIQSFGGRAPFDLNTISATLLALSTLTLVVAMAKILQWRLSSQRATIDDTNRPLATSTIDLP